MTTFLRCDQCGAEVRGATEGHFHLLAYPSGWDGPDSDARAMDFCSLACMVAWADAQRDLSPEPVDRATHMLTQTITTPESGPLRTSVPMGVWTETVKRMD